MRESLSRFAFGGCGTHNATRKTSLQKRDYGIPACVAVMERLMLLNISKAYLGVLLWWLCLSSPRNVG